MRIFGRTCTALFCSLTLILGASGVAFSVDQLAVDGDLADVDFSGPNVVGDEPLALGAVCPNTVTPAAAAVANVKLAVQNSGNGFETGSFQNSAPVTFSVVGVTLTNDAVGGAKGTIAAGMADAPANQVTLPVNWQSQAAGTKSTAVLSKVTLTVPATATSGGTLTADVAYKAAGTGRTGGSDASPNIGLVERPKTLAVSWSVKPTSDPSCVTNTAPVLTVPADYSVEATGPDGALVNYAGVSAQDAEDGDLTSQVSCDPPDGSQLTLGPHTVECSVTDSGGLSESGSFTVTVVDTTDPTITYVTRTPAANSHDWNNSNVTVSWSCADAGSGVVDPTISQTVSTEGYNQSAAGTCTDLAGNTTSDTQTGINIDKTAPTIAFASALPAANGNGWNNSDVTVTWSCSDGLSGFVAETVSQTLSGEGADQSATGTCTDNAGNEASDTHRGINIDKTAPTVSITSPSNADSTWASSVTVIGTASDALSGLASLTVNGTAVTVSSGAFSASNVALTCGANTITAQATDKAGNSYSASITVNRRCATLRFLSPMDASTWTPTLTTIVKNTGKNGRVIPVKVEIIENGGSELTSADLPAGSVTIRVSKMTSTSASTSDPVETYADAGQSNANTSQFRWSSDAPGFWIYNLDTTGLGLVTNSCYRIDVFIAGSQVSIGQFVVFQPIR